MGRAILDDALGILFCSLPLRRPAAPPGGPPGVSGVRNASCPPDTTVIPSRSRQAAASLTMSTKVHTQDLALFGAAPLFEIPRSISNLVRPDIERFLDYSKTIFATGRYTGHASAVSLLEQ